ncbi:protein LNK3 isoform X3 [Helianthus annuus]|uniref:protein LNK3 isoform X3 n=1 Tax=Helianthus annuus TaxID=4232 RepID=UPI000B8F155A|nr:protein LNK3 isoform X3 [Helianthus annuus]
MEWYYGTGEEDLVVPKDYEKAQTIPSQESLLQWGMTSFGNSNPKKYFDSNINMTHEELYNNGGSLLWNDEADFQQFAEEEARINNMDDDIFFSLLEEDPINDSAKTHDNTILGNNVDNIEGEMVNSQYVARHGQSIGSSKYLKTHDFSPPADWANGNVSTTYQVPKQYTSNENSMEAFVLNDLERVTAQFTDKTRICFRDAFYRLAESSKQPFNSCQNGESSMISDDDTLRARETEDAESNTNVIDRAVANLIFHKSDFDDTCNRHQTNYNDDAEVPLSMQELPQSTAF